MYSALIVISSLATCIFQAFIYPWVVNSLNVPSPYFAILGCIIVFISFIVISVTTTEMICLVASLVLSLGFCCATPCSITIISVFIE